MGTTGRRNILGIFRNELTRETPSPVVGVAGIDTAKEGPALSALTLLQNNGKVRLAGLWSPSERSRDTAGTLLKIPDQNRFHELDGLLQAGGSGRASKIDVLLMLGNAKNQQEEIRKTLLQKIHVVADSPLSQTAREAESLIEISARSGVHLGVIHSDRYLAIHAEPLWAVREHKLGEILHVRISRPRRVKSNPDTSVDELLADLYTDVYLARAWADSPIISVAAHVENRIHRGQFVSVCLVSFEHAGGGWTTLHQTDTIGPATEVYEIHGVEGSIRIDQQDNAWYLCRRSAKREGTHWERNEPAPETLRGGFPMEELAPQTDARPYARALDDAFASLARGLPPPVDGREGWLNLRAIDAIRESAQTGNVVRVDISFPR